MLCDRLGIDIWEVVDAASTKPFGFMRFEPGPGMGGHCLPVDPFYLAFKAREHDMPTEFVELAGKINQQQPHYCVERIASALNDAGLPVNGSRVLLLGVAYKGGVSDMREAPALEDRSRLARPQGGSLLQRPARPRARPSSSCARGRSRTRWPTATSPASSPRIRGRLRARRGAGAADNRLPRRRPRRTRGRDSGSRRPGRPRRPRLDRDAPGGDDWAVRSPLRQTRSPVADRLTVGVAAAALVTAGTVVRRRARPARPSPGPAGSRGGARDCRRARDGEPRDPRHRPRDAGHVRRRQRRLRGDPEGGDGPVQHALRLPRCVRARPGLDLGASARAGGRSAMSPSVAATSTTSSPGS